MGYDGLCPFSDRISNGALFLIFSFDFLTTKGQKRFLKENSSKHSLSGLKCLQTANVKSLFLHLTFSDAVSLCMSIAKFLFAIFCSSIFIVLCSFGKIKGVAKCIDGSPVACAHKVTKCFISFSLHRLFQKCTSARE